MVQTPIAASPKLAGSVAPAALTAQDELRLEGARKFCHPFFNGDNWNHYHVGVGLMIPDQIHDGQTDIALQRKNTPPSSRFQENAERFVNKVPAPGLTRHHPNAVPDCRP
jgi:hypothetical protein